jgi:predicted lipid-binding transport protein (Tim44 family)
LAALASYLGFGEELMSMLLIVAGVLLAVFLFRLVMSRGRQAQPAAAGIAGAAGTPMARTALPDTQLGEPIAQPVQPQSQETSEEDVERFLSVAREQFLHLQRVWDEGRLDDIRGFTTEGMAEGLRQQLFQRGPSANVTTVDELHVEWFGQSRDTGDEGQPVDAVFIRFHGLIREAVDALPTHFDETWTLHKTVGDPNAGWLLAGITQNAQS